MAKGKKRKNQAPSLTQDSTIDEADMPIFFYMPGDTPYGVFCQWYPSTFTAPCRYFKDLWGRGARTATTETASVTETAEMPESFIDDEGKVSFNCAEQFMMYAKAIYFHETHSATRILASIDPKEQKRLGREVIGFSEDRWKTVREEVAEMGNWCKFGQDERLRAVLMGTGVRELCEASSRDRVWGIGFKENEAKRMVLSGSRGRWGANLLGKALMRVRERLKVQESEGLQELDSVQSGLAGLV
jgi:ribA/ribD-fused uncharacterized protein